MQDQAAGVADIGEMREQAHALDQLDPGLEAALDAEGEHRARAFRQVFLRQLVIGAVLEPGVGNPGDLRDARARNSATFRAFSTWRSMRTCRVSMPVIVRKAFIGASAGPKSRKRHRARLRGEGEIAEILEELQPVIGGLRLGQRGKAVALRPVELARLDHHAAERIAMARQELGRRMDDDVGAVLDRPAEIGRGQRVVDDQRNARLMGDLRDRARCRRRCRRDWRGSR